VGKNYNGLNQKQIRRENLKNPIGNRNAPAAKALVFIYKRLSRDGQSTLGASNNNEVPQIRDKPGAINVEAGAFRRTVGTQSGQADV
jgi:hypothetical protein